MAYQSLPKEELALPPPYATLKSSNTSLSSLTTASPLLFEYTPNQVGLERPQSTSPGDCQQVPHSSPIYTTYSSYGQVTPTQINAILITSSLLLCATLLATVTLNIVFFFIHSIRTTIQLTNASLVLAPVLLCFNLVQIAFAFSKSGLRWVPPFSLVFLACSGMSLVIALFIFILQETMAYISVISLFIIAAMQLLFCLAARQKVAFLAEKEDPLTFIPMELDGAVVIGLETTV